MVWHDAGYAMADHDQDLDLTKISEAYENWEQEQESRRDAAIRNRSEFQGLQVDPDIDFYPEVADREPGDKNIVKWGFDIHPQVTFSAAGFLLVFILATLIFPEQASGVFATLLNFINEKLGWLYIISFNIFIGAAIYFAGGQVRQDSTRRSNGPSRVLHRGLVRHVDLCRSRYRADVLGCGRADLPPDITPAPVRRRTLIGGRGQSRTGDLLPPLGDSWLGAVRLGSHLPGVLRLQPRTTPDLSLGVLSDSGSEDLRRLGNAIDVLTVVATLFGLATSLGFGAGQAAAGLNKLFGLPSGTGFQIVLIVFITGLATISVVAGLDAGVKRLSQINVWLAAAFLIFVLLVGPTLPDSLALRGEHRRLYPGAPGVLVLERRLARHPVAAMVDHLLLGLVDLLVSLRRHVHRPNLQGALGAGNDRRCGRPSLPPVLPMVRGVRRAAMDLQMRGTLDVATAVNENVATALFVMLEAFPWTFFVSMVGVLLLVSFFVTSSDSGSLVVDHLTSGGKLDSPKPQRVFWAMMEGLVAIVLLIGGGLSALQTAAVATGLPFLFVLLIMLWSLKKAFDEELDLLESHYDEAIFRSQHSGLLERMGTGGEK